MAIQIRELFAEAIELSELKTDERWKQWVKYVDEIDHRYTNGFAFKGNFIDQGRIEVEIGLPKVILVCTTTGRNQKRLTSHYRVLLMSGEGSLIPTPIQTSSSQPGWAMRIMGDVSDLLNEIADEEPRTFIEVVFEENEAWRTIRATYGDEISDEALVLEALSVWQEILEKQHED